MKAVVVEEPGKDRVLLTQVPVPTIGPGQALVRVRAAGLNRADINIRDGKFAEAVYPIVLGVEGAGDVVEVADDVTTLRPGQRVVVNPMAVCGVCEFCEAGLDSECPSLQVVGEHFDGTYAEYVCLPARNLIVAPDNLSYADLAASVVPYMTAWHMLKTRGDLKPGETALIVGAGSGVGSAAVQVAKTLGAHVIATTSTDDKTQKLKDIGADEVVNYRLTPNFDEHVRSLTGGAGADLVHETVGSASVQKSIQSARHGGRVVGMGSHTGRVAEIDLWQLYRREVTFIGCHTSNRREIDEFIPLLASGGLSPIIDSTYQIDDIHKAHDRLMSNDRFGKVILHIN